MHVRRFAALGLMILLGIAEHSVFADDPPISERARKIHESGMVFDGHNDLPWRLRAAGDMGLDSIDLTQAVRRPATPISQDSATAASRRSSGRFTSPASTSNPLADGPGADRPGLSAGRALSR